MMTDDGDLLPAFADAALAGSAVAIACSHTKRWTVLLENRK